LFSCETFKGPVFLGYSQRHPRRFAAQVPVEAAFLFQAGEVYSEFSKGDEPKRDGAMSARLRGLRKAMLGLIALLVLAALPAAVRAEILYFRNDSGGPVIVQGSCLVRGKLVNDRPNLVQPGDKVKINLQGDKLITIREAKAPNDLLHKETIRAGKADQYILITPDPKAKLKLDVTTAKEFAKGAK